MAELTLAERVDKGIAWLSEHDSNPPGRFYMWVRGGITPDDAMPAQPEVTRQRFREWFAAFELWEALYAQLERESLQSEHHG